MTDELELCGWCMPDDAQVDHARISCCLCPPRHRGSHIVADSTSRSANFYEVDVDEHTMMPAIHADLRDDHRQLDRQELAAILMVLRPELWEGYGA